MSDAAAHRILSPRLLARCWSPDDAEAFRALLDANDRHLRPFIPWMRQEPQPLEATRARLAAHRERFLAGRDFRYALCEREGRLIGELILSTRSGPGSREVGYLVDHACTGRGYATEAAAMALRAGFGLGGVERILLYCSPDNRPSVRVAEKLGFSLLRLLPKHAEDSTGELSDLMEWELRREAFAATLAATLPVQAFDAQGRTLALAH